MPEARPALNSQLALTVAAYDLLDGQRPARLVPASEATRAIVARIIQERGEA